MANDGIQRNDNRKGFKTVQFSAYSKEIDVIMKKISFLEVSLVLFAVSNTGLHAATSADRF